MNECQPGLLPHLLGCVSDKTDDGQCQDVTFSCALLSLLVALMIAVTVCSAIYIVCSRFNKSTITSQTTTDITKKD
jgi:hypothetical protein